MTCPHGMGQSALSIQVMGCWYYQNTLIEIAKNILIPQKCSNYNVTALVSSENTRFSAKLLMATFICTLKWHLVLNIHIGKISIP